MVTHEREIALRTKRIINVLDGKIVSDEILRRDISANQEVVSKSAKDMFSRKNVNLLKSLLGDHIPQAIKSILSHKMRSALSMLGILIGVGAVIAMLAIGKGAEESMSKNLSALGTNLLTVMPGSQKIGGVALEAGSVTRFTIEDADAIAKIGGSIKAVSPTARGSGQVVYGNKNCRTTIQGVGLDYAAIKSAQPKYGRFFTKEELRGREKVALIGATVIKNIYGSSNPVGTTVKINKVNFTVIGVLPEKGATGFQDEDDIVIMPVTTAMYRLLGKKYIDSIDVEIKEVSMMDDAESSIKKIVIKRHNLTTSSQLESFSIRNMADLQATLKSMTGTMSMLLGCIAAISLLVGGIGIMNIMLVSVTERTREIGLRKAIGAQGKDIMLQFLIEAIVMTFCGGLLGILSGVLIATVLTVFAGWTVTVTANSVLLSTVFSIIIGISFGLFPARQASKLNPIEALRFE